MKLKNWAYIILGSGLISVIFILLSTIHVIFPLIGFLVLAAGVILSHIFCRCPNCDGFINVGLVIEATRKKIHCHKCGKPIDANTKIEL